MTYLPIDDEATQVLQEDDSAEVILTPKRVVNTRKQQLTSGGGGAGAGRGRRERKGTEKYAHAYVHVYTHKYLRI